MLTLVVAAAATCVAWAADTASLSLLQSRAHSIVTVMKNTLQEDGERPEPMFAGAEVDEKHHYVEFLRNIDSVEDDGNDEERPEPVLNNDKYAAVLSKGNKPIENVADEVAMEGERPEPVIYGAEVDDGDSYVLLFHNNEAIEDDEDGERPEPMIASTVADTEEYAALLLKGERMEDHGDELAMEGDWPEPLLADAEMDDDDSYSEPLHNNEAIQDDEDDGERPDPVIASMLGDTEVYAAPLQDGDPLGNLSDEVEGERPEPVIANMVGDTEEYAALPQYGDRLENLSDEVEGERPEPVIASMVGDTEEYAALLQDGEHVEDLGDDVAMGADRPGPVISGAEVDDDDSYSARPHNNETIQDDEDGERPEPMIASTVADTEEYAALLLKGERMEDLGDEVAMEGERPEPVISSAEVDYDDSYVALLHNKEAIQDDEDEGELPELDNAGARRPSP